MIRYVHHQFLDKFNVDNQSLVGPMDELRGNVITLDSQFVVSRSIMQQSWLIEILHICLNGSETFFRNSEQTFIILYNQLNIIKNGNK